MWDTCSWRREKIHTLWWWLVCGVSGAFLTRRRDASILRAVFFTRFIVGTYFTVDFPSRCFARWYTDTDTTYFRMISFQSLYLDLSLRCEWRGLKNYMYRNKMTDVGVKSCPDPTQSHCVKKFLKKIMYLSLSKQCPEIRCIFMTNHLFSYRAFFFSASHSMVHIAHARAYIHIEFIEYINKRKYFIISHNYYSLTITYPYS